MSDMINVILPDGSQKSVEQGSSVADVAQSIGAGLFRAAIAGKINGELCDLSQHVADQDHIEILTNKSSEALDIMRHSCAHIAAEAVSELFDDVQLAIGPTTDNGFFYDLIARPAISSDDFERIEARMKEIIKKDEPFVREEITRDEAREIFANQPFKLELIEDLSDDETISIYRHGSHVELCRGPHVSYPHAIGAFTLNKLAGAYWKGDAENEQLQRLYGTCFFTKKELDEYLDRMEQARARDHRILGAKLGLFETLDEAGSGLPLFFPKGTRVINTLKDWLRAQLYERGYEEVQTPHIYKADVWKTSGHYDFYHDDMYFFDVNEGSEDDPRIQEFGVKPMNCPGHVLLYKSNLHSYREMPIRFFEFGTVYRNELSGAVHGLMRARGFTQDDAHIFCREDQVVSEVRSVLDLVDIIMSEFGLTYSAEISTRPAHSIGTDEMWEKAESFLKQALEDQGLAYEINPGDGAFYGPKIDIKVQDSIGRVWQCSTVQVDFNLPERFDITYRTQENTQARPWMLHRAIFGSIERFLGILIEHTAGALPVWLSPVQVEIVPIADRHLDYAQQVADALVAHGARVEIASQSEPMRAKIAKAQEQKIPFMLVVGDKEQQDKTVSVRERQAGDKGVVKLDEFVDEFVKLTK